MRPLLYVLLLMPLVLAPSNPQDTKPQESIEALIRHLRSDETDLRDQATETLLHRWKNKAKHKSHE